MLPCHDQDVVFAAPFVAYDDGGADYETAEATFVCETCKRLYLATNVGRVAHMNLRDGEPEAAQFTKLRDRITGKRH
jgi:hypothetical protein